MGDLDVTMSKWHASTDSNPHTSERIMNFNKIVNIPGCKQTRGSKTQILRSYSQEPEGDVIGLLLLSATKVEDVPYAHYFTVNESIMVYTREDHVMLSIYVEVIWIKSTMLK